MERYAWHLSDSFKTSAGMVRAGQTGAGPSLVLAHGWPWSSYAWHRIIPTLAKTHQVYWYDMPGYGQSDMRADQPTSLDVQGKVFAEMLSLWGLDEPTVIAHDFGGATALRAHLLHGCDFKRLVMMNVVAIRPWGSAFFDHVGKHIAAFQGLPPHIHHAVVTAYIQNAIISDVSEHEIAQLVAPWTTKAGTSSFYRQFAQADEAFTAEIEPMFGTIRCPTMIIWGADDPWIPVARGRALHLAVGQGHFALLEGVRHLPQLEAPQQVLDALKDFI